MTLRLVRRALLSVFDKSHLLDFARGLAAFGIELVSTGGTHKALVAGGLAVKEVSELTGLPEMLDGRVKTLHPTVHGGILHIRDNPAHVARIAELGIGPIDMVVVNLYPFEATVANPTSTPEQIIENIDIGGPAMIRSAAKNHHDVAVVTSPHDYGPILDEMRNYGGATTLQTRQQLAGAAFARTAAYDRAISAWFASQSGGEMFPSRLELAFEKRSELRYGENPHQQAAFYVESPTPSGCVAGAAVLHGKELSYNNLLDLDSALNLAREFSSPAVAIIKHNNPCGCATNDTLVEAFGRAWEGDPVSAFGGVIACNREIDEATALLMSEPGRFVECIIAPDFSNAAFEILTTRPSWKKNVRLLRCGPTTLPTGLDFRRISGGLLVQGRDQLADEFAKLDVKTKRSPSEAERADLLFAWLVCKHVKSNAIVFAKDGMVVGVGAGQMSRIDSTRIAASKAGTRSQGAAMASDAFFPFRDNIDEAAKAGIRAIAQPGGSLRDGESIAACDENGIAMVMTGVRHFRH
jgi:phosphoribosylaminoimidazolecarboxamide formyltransferase/IMP cyclohydrolase